MRVRALFFVLLIGAFSNTGCATPAAADGEDVDLSQEALDRANINMAGFKDIPALTPWQRSQIVNRYASIPHRGVRQDLFEDAILYYDTNINRIANKAFLSILDFSKPSGERRFFVLDMGGGPATSHVVAHGEKSDPNNDGLATQFSNEVGSLQSSVGFYVTAETYQGKHGESLRLDGLSPTNSKVRERAIVIHSADYVKDGLAKQGMSWGCLAFSQSDKPEILRRLKEGSLIYASN